MKNIEEHFRVLRIIDSISELSSPYKQFTLPLLDRQNISICTFFEKVTDCPAELNVFGGDGTFMGFFKALKKALDSREYDIVHVHSPHLGVLVLVSAIFFKRDILRRSIYTVHSSLINYRLKHRIMLTLIMPFYRRIVCCSRSSYESMPRLYRWLAGRRMCFIPNGVNVARIDKVGVASDRNSIKKPFTIISIGRLIAIKNPLDILKSFWRIKYQECRLLYIGDGALKSELLFSASEAGVSDKVLFTGSISRDEVYKYLTEADLFISASSAEGLPVGVLEAMACACPVILSDIPPHREIANEVSFIPLVKPSNIEGFAREIIKFQQMDPSARFEIGKKCRSLVIERFGMRAMHDKYERLYHDVIEQDLKVS